METLMKLIDGCERTVKKDRKAKDHEQYAYYLKRLGFNKKAEKLSNDIDTLKRVRNIERYGYVMITEENIGKYLCILRDKYNKKAKNKKYPVISNNAYLWFSFSSSAVEEKKPANEFDSNLRKYTFDYLETKGIGKYEWDEEKVSEYKGIPPLDVLKTMDHHFKRQCFDEFTVATVKSIPDPLLIGRINGSKIRYFIAQWGNDILLDDLI